MTKLSATSYLRKAERALDEARLLLREQATEGACSRAYYAMHDAAHAALIAVGHETPDVLIKTHHSLIAAFGKQLVQGGYVDSALGRAFNKVICRRDQIEVRGLGWLAHTGGTYNGRVRGLGTRMPTDDILVSTSSPAIPTADRDRV